MLFLANRYILRRKQSLSRSYGAPRVIWLNYVRSSFLWPGARSQPLPIFLSSIKSVDLYRHVCAHIKMSGICTVAHVCHLVCVPSAFSHSNTSTLSVTKLHYERNISAHTYEMRYWFAIWYCNTRRRAVGLQTTYWLVAKAWNRNTLWNPHDVDTHNINYFFKQMH